MDLIAEKSAPYVRARSVFVQPNHEIRDISCYDRFLVTPLV